MGPLIFVGLVAVALVVMGFLIYGMFLGLAQLGRTLKRLCWPDLYVDERAAVDEASRIIAGARCWESKQCAENKRADCAAYNRPGMPCWLAKMLATENYQLKPECVACSMFSLPALLN